MSPFALLLTLLACIAAGYACAEAGRLRRQLEADLSALTDLDCAFADREVEIDKTVRAVADHFRRSTVGDITPETLVKDAVVACPALREMFLSRRGDKPRMIWDVTIREFAAQFAQDPDALMRDVRTVQGAEP